MCEMCESRRATSETTATEVGAGHAARDRERPTAFTATRMPTRYGFTDDVRQEEYVDTGE